MSATIYGYIYEITNKVNNKVYIGQTVQTVARRWQGHRYDALRGSTMAIHKAMKKYGLENFFIEVMCEASSKDELNRLEQTYISGFNTLSPNGYNLRSGGQSDYEYSEEARKRLSEAQIKHWGDPEVRERASKSAIKRYEDPEQRRLNTERQVERFKDPEQRRKISEAKIKFYKENPEAGKNISEAQLDRKASEETKQKISTALKGRVGHSKGKIGPNKGKKFSEEAKNNMSKARLGKKASKETKQKMSLTARSNLKNCNRKQIIDSNGIIYPSILQASLDLNIHRNSISNNISGLTKHAGGLTFQYYIPKDSQDYPEFSITDI